MNAVPPPDPAAKNEAPPAPSGIPVVEVRQLLGEGREVILLHLGEAYRLRITARDKLILTK